MGLVVGLFVGLVYWVRYGWIKVYLVVIWLFVFKFNIFFSKFIVEKI